LAGNTCRLGIGKIWKWRQRTKPQQVELNHGWHESEKAENWAMVAAQFGSCV